MKPTSQSNVIIKSGCLILNIVSSVFFLSGLRGRLSRIRDIGIRIRKIKQLSDSGFLNRERRKAKKGLPRKKRRISYDELFLWWNHKLQVLQIQHLASLQLYPSVYASVLVQHLSQLLQSTQNKLSIQGLNKEKDNENIHYHFYI